MHRSPVKKSVSSDYEVFGRVSISVFADTDIRMISQWTCLILPSLCMLFNWLTCWPLKIPNLWNITVIPCNDTYSAKALGQNNDKNLTSSQSPEEDGLHSPIILMLWVTGCRHLLLPANANVPLTGTAIFLLVQLLCAKDTQTYAKKRVQLKKFNCPRIV